MWMKDSLVKRYFSNVTWRWIINSYSYLMANANAKEHQWTSNFSTNVENNGSDEAISNLTGVHKILDDILIQAPDELSLSQSYEQHQIPTQSMLLASKVKVDDSIKFAGYIYQRMDPARPCKSKSSASLPYAYHHSWHLFTSELGQSTQPIHTWCGPSNDRLSSTAETG